MLPLVVSAVEVDGVVAKVGADTILRSDVLNEMHRMGMEDGSRFNEVRNEMINRRLILQAATAAKMSMQEWVIDGRVREIIQRSFGGDRNKLIEMLSRQKVSFPEWRAKLKEDMVVGAMRWNVVDKNVAASPTAMKKEFAEHPERYVTNHRISVSVITLKPEELSRKAEIDAQLKSKSFAELGGRKYEKIIPSDQFAPAVASEIEQLPIGQISKWIDIDGWNFLIRKDDETGDKKMTFEEAYEQIEANVKEVEAKRIYEEWINRLREETYIKVF